jgi:hypothetical protein
MQAGEQSSGQAPEQEEEEQPLHDWRMSGQPESTQQFLMQEFHTPLQGFERCASYLRQIAGDFSRLPRTPEQKRQVIEMSDEQFEMMESELGYMQRAVERMSRPDGESFEQRLAGCQEEFAQLCALFASLKQEISDQEASTSPPEDPKPPGMPTFKCPPVPHMQAGEQSSGQEVPEEDSGEKARQQEEEDQRRNILEMWGPGWYNQRPLRDDFVTLLQEFERCTSWLRERADYFSMMSRMATLKEKRHVIAGSDEKFEMM